MTKPHKNSLKAIQIVTFFLIILMGYTSYGKGDIPESLRPQKELLYIALRNEGFNNEEIDRIFSDPRIGLYPDILKKSGKGINYFSKKFGLLTPDSIARGKRIIDEHKSLLKKIETTYGVEKEFIVAIMRIETDFGRHTGMYPVFNSLLTYTLFENRRSLWAKRELIALLVFCKRIGVDPLSINGSWAGAFGLCQFVPTSFMKYAVDGNDDGKIDLFDFHDACASIANYLKANGWQKDSMKQKKKALYAYNHCRNYVSAVIAYAKATKT